MSDKLVSTKNVVLYRGPVEEVHPKYYQVGQIFRHKNGDTYMIVQCCYPPTCALINTAHGSRWTDHQTVVYSGRITEQEFHRLCGNQSQDFKLISK